VSFSTLQKTDVKRFLQLAQSTESWVNDISLFFRSYSKSKQKEQKLNKNRKPYLGAQHDPCFTPIFTSGDRYGIPKFKPLNTNQIPINNNHQGSNFDQYFRTLEPIRDPTNPKINKLGILPNPKPIIKNILPPVVP
jgi:hypothetical protein